jgi:hypothetical protein
MLHPIGTPTNNTDQDRNTRLLRKRLHHTKAGFMAMPHCRYCFAVIFVKLIKILALWLIDIHNYLTVKYIYHYSRVL